MNPILSTQENYQAQYNYLCDRYELPATQILVFPCLASTNLKAWEVLEQNPTNLPLAVTAIEQTAGKGQWGKTWQSTPGGLYLSVAIAVDLPLADSFHLVMITAVGITSLLREYDLPVKLKWSNDLILAGRKLGGIKLETKTQGARVSHAVVGVGLNWQNITPEVGISLQEYSEQHPCKISSLEQLNAIATVGIIRGYQTYIKQGIEPIYQQYQQQLNSIGRQVTLDLDPIKTDTTKTNSNTKNSGVVTGVTRRGKLEILLSAPGASSKIYVSPGEISLGYKAAK